MALLFLTVFKRMNPKGELALYRRVEFPDFPIGKSGNATHRVCSSESGNGGLRVLIFSCEKIRPLHPSYIGPRLMRASYSS
jgi:hypothetical protein